MIRWSFYVIIFMKLFWVTLIEFEWVWYVLFLHDCGRNLLHGITWGNKNCNITNEHLWIPRKFTVKSNCLNLFTNRFSLFHKYNHLFQNLFIIAKFDTNIENLTFSQCQFIRKKKLLTAVGFEPTPFLTGA